MVSHAREKCSAKPQAAVSREPKVPSFAVPSRSLRTFVPYNRAMLVALTGASGFIGSYTARALHGAGHDVRALVRSTSRREHIADSVAEWREGDASDPQAIAGLVAGVDAVIHNAADWDALERSPGSN